MLTRTETTAALATVERFDRASVEAAVRKVVNVAGAELYGVGSGSQDEVVRWLADTFDRLRGILRDAGDRGFGLAVQVVL